MEIIVHQLHKMGMSMCASLCEAVGHLLNQGGGSRKKREK